MTINSKTLAALLVIILFGGIMASSTLGWWTTESTKEPVKFSEGEYAGQANPADIRGSYTFGDVANAFDVTPAVLAQAFGITEGDPAAFSLKELETIYADSPLEIGTGSVRLFVAFYTGLPYDLATAEETYLPQAATDILLEKGNLDAERLAFVETHTITPGMEASTPEAPSTPEAATTPAAESTEHTTATVEPYVIKGKTTFADLLSWGVPQAEIEKLIGAALPDPTMLIKDYATAKSLDFEVLKPALQAEVDKVKK